MLLGSQQAITISQLSAELEVSNRTIHRDLKAVAKILTDHQLTLSRKSGSGLQVIGHSKEKKKLQIALKDVQHTDYTPAERQTIILLALLETNEPIKLYNLSLELQVTIATISNDLDKVEEQLVNYELTLVRRRGFGVKLLGEETDKRAAISHLLINQVNEFDLVSLFKQNVSYKSKQHTGAISDRLLGVIDPNKLNIIEHEVKEVSNLLPHEFADSAYIGLVVHLALAIERLQKGEMIKFSPTYLKEIQEFQEYDIAAQMIKKLESALSMQIPNDEVGYITMHLLGAKLQVDQDHLTDQSNLNLIYQTKKLINYVSQTLRINLQNNSRLLTDLVTHLKPTIYRLNQKMKIKNPLMDEIIKDYEELFQVIEDGVDESFPNISFPKEEIGYLVLHFGAAFMRSKESLTFKTLVICPSGIGTAKMLAENLYQKIPEIKQIENRSLFDLDRVEVSAYDLIISTIPLPGEHEYILASPILTKEDIQRIRKVITRKKLNVTVVNHQHETDETKSIVEHLRAIQNYTEAMVEILDHFQIQTVIKYQDIREILFVICEKFLHEDIVTNVSEIVEALLKREKVSGLGIPNTNLAFFHTRSDAVKKINFTIHSLQTPLKIKGMDNQQMDYEKILLMLAPKHINSQVLEVLSLLSALIIQDEETMLLFQTGDEQEIQSFISKQFYQFINKKQQ